MIHVRRSSSRSNPVEQLIQAEREVCLDALVFEDAGDHGTR
jgi:hypothetical protein